MDRKIEKKKFTPRKVIMFTGISVAVLYIIYLAFISVPSSSFTVNKDRITITEVQSGLFQEFITVNGTVIPIRTIYLDAVEGGRVDRMFHEGGSFIREGDTILVMLNNNLQLDVLNREAQILEQINNLQNTRLALQQQRISLRSQLLTQQTNLEQRKREYERERELFNRNLTSEHQYLDAKQLYEQVLRRRDLFSEQIMLDSIATENQLNHIDGSLTRMMTNLDLVTKSLDHLTLRAPISGQLTSLDAEIGESIVRGQRLGQIDVLDGYKIRVPVDEHYIARVSTGQKGELDFSGTTYYVEISKVYPEVSDGRFQVDMEFTDNEPQGIRSGQSMRVRLELGDLSEAVMLVRGGFFQRTGGNWVYVVDRSGSEASRRSIRVGRQNTNFFEILDGLQPGEMVITSSYENFSDSDRLLLK